MAQDKTVDSLLLDRGLADIADAIRTKGGTEVLLSFPDGMASAIAAIPGGGEDEAEFRKWTVTVPSDAASSKTLYLLKDDWLAEHWNDPGLEAFLVPANETAGTTKTYFAFAYGRNGHMNGTTSIYGFSVRIQGTGASITSSTYQLGVSANSLQGCISVTSSGDLKIRAASTCVVAAGDYTVYAHLR